MTVSCTTASATATSAEGLFSSQPATSVPPAQPAPATTVGTGSITSSAIAPTVAATVSGGGGMKSSSSHSSGIVESGLVLVWLRDLPMLCVWVCVLLAGSKSHSSSVPHAAGMVYPHQMLPHFAAPYGNAPMMVGTVEVTLHKQYCHVRILAYNKMAVYTAILLHNYVVHSLTYRQ